MVVENKALLSFIDQLCRRHQLPVWTDVLALTAALAAHHHSNKLNVKLFIRLFFSYLLSSFSFLGGYRCINRITRLTQMLTRLDNCFVLPWAPPLVHFTLFHINMGACDGWGTIDRLQSCQFLCVCVCLWHKINEAWSVLVPIDPVPSFHLCHIFFFSFFFSVNRWFLPSIYRRIDLCANYQPDL